MRKLSTLNKDEIIIVIYVGHAASASLVNCIGVVCKSLYKNLKKYTLVVGSIYFLPDALNSCCIHK